ncbi:MAG: metallophosphoesterase [Pseudomonas oryzihabitans]
MTDSPDFHRRRLCLALAGLPLLAACKPTQGYGLAERRSLWFEDHSFTPVKPMASAGSFVLGVLPDTQYYSENNFEMTRTGERVERYPGLGYPPALAFHAQTHWLANNARALNMPFVVHLGDLVEDAEQHGEWRLASQAMARLERAGLPYSVMTGDHDVIALYTEDRLRDGSELFTQYFSPERAARQSTFLERDATGLNEAHRFTALGQGFLLLTLDWFPSEQSLAWAQSVLDRYPHLPTILASHNIVDLVNGQAVLSNRRNDTGVRLWNRLIRRNDQIFLTLNGHNHGSGHLRLANDFGRPVDLLLINYQTEYAGGNGLLRLLELDLARGRLEAFTYSPWVAYRQQSGDLPVRLGSDPRDTYSAEVLAPLASPQFDNRFVLDVDFASRFAGFGGYTAQLPAVAEESVLARMRQQLGIA